MPELSPEWHIASLHVEGVRLFDQLDINFSPGFNLLVGPNGCGKTSILRCLNLCCSLDDIQDSRFLESACFWGNVKYGSELVRIGQGNTDRNALRTISYHQNQLHSYIKPPPSDVGPTKTINAITDELPYLAPLTIGAYRKIDYRRLDGMKRELSVIEAQRKYRREGSKYLCGTTLPDPKQWMVNRYFQVDKDWAVIERANWEWIIKNMDRIGPTGSGLYFRNIMRELEPMFELNGKECYLEELSAGYQAVLSMVFGIVEWIEAINEGERRLTEHATGTVLIDELDCHLHPEWQLSIRDALVTLFPGLQFIATTHSPHLIATAKPGEVLCIPVSDGTLTVTPEQRSYNGWTTDQILTELMGVTNLENKAYARLINQAMDAFQKRDAVALDSAINALAEVAHPDDTIVTVLKMKLSTLALEADA
ncbi:MAG: AAA family ATPase [Armatimonadota bacterium]